MKPYLPRAARNYLEQLRRELAFLTDTERHQILADTRQQILHLPGKGRRRADLLAELGQPAALAGRFQRTEPEELKVSSGRQFLTRILAWPIFALCLLTAALIVLAPAPVQLVDPAGLGVLPGTGPTASSQLETVIGSQILWLAFIPALFSLLPLVVRGVPGTLVQVLGAVATTLLCVSDLPGLGLFFAPLALLLWAQVFTPLLMMRGSMARPGPGWLIVAAAVLVLVVGFATWRGLTGFSGPMLLVLVPGVVLALLGILLPTRWRWAQIALVIAGLLVMIAGTIAGWPQMYGAPVLWPWLAGATAFATGHLGLAAGMWHERARNLLALL